MLSPLDAWVLLRLKRTPDSFVLAYEDSGGVHTAIPEGRRAPEQWPSLPLEPDLREVRFPPELVELLRATSAPFPDHQFSPHSTGPKPLGVFLEELDQVAPEDLVAFARSLLRATGLPETRFAFAVAPQRPWRERPHFRLPLRVLAIGSKAAGAVGPITVARWYQEPEVRTHGIPIDFAEVQQLIDPQLDLVVPDVMVVDAEAMVEVMVMLHSSKRWVGRAPRVFVSIGGPLSDRSTFEALPVGASMLVIGDALPPDRFFEAFLLGIVHDYPLHEAVETAAREVGGREHTILYADPVTNQSLRIADALEDLLDRSDALEYAFQVDDVEGFLSRRPLPEHAVEMLQKSASADAQVREALSASRDVGGDFGRESRGLGPMAHAEAAMERGTQAMMEAEASLARIGEDHEVVRMIAEAQERRVDIGLEAAYRDLAARPMFVRWDPRWLLDLDQRCRVRVHIGNRDPDSVVVGPPDTIDPLLPPSDKGGHQLEVAFFPKNFRLHTAPVRRLRLPRLGGSLPVYFEFTTPPEEAVLEARIGVYHRNHLVQSFRFRAAVGAHDGDGAAIEAVQDFSRSRVFSNLDYLRARELSVGVNETRPGTHSFTWKRGDRAEIVNLPEALLDDNVTKFRQMLVDATLAAGDKPRFPGFPVAGAVPGEDARRAVRAFARFGEALYRSLWPEGTHTFKAMLREVRESADQTIQITRHDQNYVFPWAVLYDRPLPDVRKGDPEPAVCFGHPLDEASGRAADPAKPLGCPHNPDRDVICVEGFWGVRHRLEEVLPVDGSDPKRRLVARDGHPVVVLALGLEDAFTERLESALTPLGQAARRFEAGGDLLDLLWDDAVRPAITVVLGHLQTKPVQGEPDEPRIRLHSVGPGDPRPPLSRWLLASTITRTEMHRGRWPGEPDGLVLLLGCGTGAIELTTLNSFVTSLASAGAAGIVGTEIALGSGLAARFAVEVVPRVYGGMPVGAAIQAFTRTLLGEGNPSPFLFNLVGDADIELVGAATGGGG